MAIFPSVTIRQVSEKANVSIATVSRALNGSAPVRKSTMERITQAMKELGVNASDVGSPEKKHTLLACFPELCNPFYSGVIQGISNAAARRGYDVVFFANEEFYSEDSYNYLETSNYYAGLLIAHNVPNQAIISRLAAKVPVVMCSEHISNGIVPFVAIDDYEAAYSSVNYLISTGRKKIACINSAMSNNYAVHRERGYRTSMTNNGLPVREEWVIHLSNVNFDLAMSSINELMRTDDHPDAFFCVSDIFAAAALKAIRANGYSVPEDVGVIGFDDIDLAVMLMPPLTTIRQPTYQLGWQACNILIEKIDGVTGSSSKVILNTDLIVRGST